MTPAISSAFKRAASTLTTLSIRVPRSRQTRRTDAHRDATVVTSLARPLGLDGNPRSGEDLPNGDIYFHRYNHLTMAEQRRRAASRQPNQSMDGCGRSAPAMRQYELANGRSANLYLQSMADATNDGYFCPGADLGPSEPPCFAFRRR
jgi:glucoamylase